MVVVVPLRTAAALVVAVQFIPGRAGSGAHRQPVRFVTVTVILVVIWGLTANGGRLVPCVVVSVMATGVVVVDLGRPP